MTNLHKTNQTLQIQFDEILVAIHKAKSRAYQNLNRELINLYWQIGEYISSKVSTKLWGKSVA
jgi:hypothetical protein